MKKTRYIPYGYTMRNGRTIVAHEEATVIQEIFDAYIKGASLKEIADELTRRKVPYTEKTNVWDKARVARILDNTKYLGEADYDPIVDRDTFEVASCTKDSRKHNSIRVEPDGIALLRGRIRCSSCGNCMVRRVNAKANIRESWQCKNCGLCVKISDSDLLQRITLLMNRIICNADLMIPKNRSCTKESVKIAVLQAEIDQELAREHPNEEFVVQKLIEIAGQSYAESQESQSVSAQIARKRVLMMEPQTTFQPIYFNDLVAYISMNADGHIVLHTKTEATIQEES